MPGASPRNSLAARRSPWAVLGCVVLLSGVCGCAKKKHPGSKGSPLVATPAESRGPVTRRPVPTLAPKAETKTTHILESGAEVVVETTDLTHSPRYPKGSTLRRTGALEVSGKTLMALRSQQIAWILSRADDNGDGKLTRDELEGDPQMAPFALRFPQLDQNGDGELTTEEFALAMPAP